MFPLYFLLILFLIYIIINNSNKNDVVKYKNLKSLGNDMKLNPISVKPNSNGSVTCAVKIAEGKYLYGESRDVENSICTVNFDDAKTIYLKYK